MVENGLDVLSLVMIVLLTHSDETSVILATPYFSYSFSSSSLGLLGL